MGFGCQYLRPIIKRGPISDFDTSQIAHQSSPRPPSPISKLSNWLWVQEDLLQAENQAADESEQVPDSKAEPSSAACERCRQHQVLCHNAGFGTTCKICDILDCECVWTRNGEKLSVPPAVPPLSSLGLLVHRDTWAQLFGLISPPSSCFTRPISLGRRLESTSLAQRLVERPENRLKTGSLLSSESSWRPERTSHNQPVSTIPEGQLFSPEMWDENKKTWNPDASLEFEREKVSRSGHINPFVTSSSQTYGSSTLCTYHDSAARQSKVGNPCEATKAGLRDWYISDERKDPVAPNKGTDSTGLAASTPLPVSISKAPEAPRETFEPEKSESGISKESLRVEEGLGDNLEASRLSTDDSSEGTWGSFSSDPSLWNPAPDSQNTITRSVSKLLQLYMFRYRDVPEAAPNSSKNSEPCSDRPSRAGQEAESARSRQNKFEGAPRKRRRQYGSQGDEDQDKDGAPEQTSSRQGPLAKKPRRRLFACPFLFLPLDRWKCRAPNIDTISHLT